MQSIHMAKENQQAMKYGLIGDVLFLCLHAFISVAIFSFALTPLGWMRNTTVALIVFAAACPVQIALVFKSRQWRTRWVHFNVVIGFVCVVIGDLMKVSRTMDFRIWFAVAGYITASLVSKLIYKWKRHDQN